MAAVRRARLATFCISLAAAAIGLPAVPAVRRGRRPRLDRHRARSVLILLSTFWLAWGAAQGLAGPDHPALGPPCAATGPIRGRTVILVPVYNEDPVTTFARIAAMDASLAATGDRARRSISRSCPTRATKPSPRANGCGSCALCRSVTAQGRIFYRRRTDEYRRARPAISRISSTRSGAAYDYAMILDADSLMEGATIVEMVRRMEADARPRPAAKPAARHQRPVALRSHHAVLRQLLLARLRARPRHDAGPHRPVLGPQRARPHPRLRGKLRPAGAVRASRPSAAISSATTMSRRRCSRARAGQSGWTTISSGSFEEGPENIVDHAKRDRRWCQGNLQHARLVMAPACRAGAAGSSCRASSPISRRCSGWPSFWPASRRSLPVRPTRLLPRGELALSGLSR